MRNLCKDMHLHDVDDRVNPLLLQEKFVKVRGGNWTALFEVRNMFPSPVNPSSVTRISGTKSQILLRARVSPPERHTY
jgi:hypothetical protein